MPELVHITWKNPENDWPYFYLLKMEGGFVKLKGADYPGGTWHHIGSVSWVHHSEILEMEVLET